VDVELEEEDQEQPDRQAAHDGPRLGRLLGVDRAGPQLLLRIYRASHSGLLDPRGSSTVRKEPGVLERTMKNRPAAASRSAAGAEVEVWDRAMNAPFSS
jgi:hypothetical protein